MATRRARFLEVVTSNSSLRRCVEQRLLGRGHRACPPCWESEEGKMEGGGGWRNQRKEGKETRELEGLLVWGSFPGSFLRANP